MSNSSLGPGRLLIAVYGVFALSASARAVFQIATKFFEAPLAYSLSLLSALVYVLATLAMALSKFRKHASWLLIFELVGVVVVGLLSYLFPSQFGHPTVWSEFGSGYGFVPLLLPILGLMWLRKNRVEDL